MPTVNDRLSTLEAAITGVRSVVYTTQVVSTESGDVEELVGMDVVQNARLGAVEQAVTTLTASLAATNATIADIQTDLADALARIAVLEQSSGYPAYVSAGLATATGLANDASVVPETPHGFAYPSAATAGGTAYTPTVTTTGYEGASTTHALPYVLGS